MNLPDIVAELEALHRDHGVFTLQIFRDRAEAVEAALSGDLDPMAPMAWDGISNHYLRAAARHVGDALALSYLRHTAIHNPTLERYALALALGWVQRTISLKQDSP